MLPIIAISATFFATVPLGAQSTTPPVTDNSVVGPPQLRDFNLNGTVTQPTPTTPAPTATPVPAPPVRESTPRPDPVERAPTVATPDRAPAQQAAPVDLPPPTAAPIIPETSFEQPTVDPAPATPVETPSTTLWPWFAALLAAALGGGFLLWRRRHAPQRYAADRGTVDAILPEPAPPPAPAAPPRPAPPPVAPTPAPPPIAGGIVASGLKPRLGLELVPLRAETDAAENATLTFDIILLNHGSAPARDVLVDAQLFNAGAQVDSEVGLFFQQPPSGGERVPVIAPMGRAALRMQLVATPTSLKPLLIEGRKLLVPVIAVNALYRWSGGEMTESGSFLIGRGDADAEKLAPLRLDLGARNWSGLAARLHSTGLQR